MTIACIIDTETTGVDETVDRIIEFAATTPIPMPSAKLLREETTVYDARFSADRPISLGAMQAHHIIDEDLKDLRPFPGFDGSRGIQYIVAHNVDFDWRMMGRPPVRRICTLALCRSLWPMAEMHTLTAMVYHLLEDKSRARSLVRAAHSAKADVSMIAYVVLPKILEQLGAVDSWESLWEISEKARIPTALSFGKHKGVPLGDVPASYKRWLLDQPDLDPYLAIALRN